MMCLCVMSADQVKEWEEEDPDNVDKVPIETDHVDGSEVAGGEVAALVAYTNDAGNAKSPDPVERVSPRADFQILIYPGPMGIPDTIPRDAPPLFLLGAAAWAFIPETQGRDLT